MGLAHFFLFLASRPPSMRGSRFCFLFFGDVNIYLVCDAAENVFQCQGTTNNLAAGSSRRAARTVLSTYYKHQGFELMHMEVACTQIHSA